MDSRIINIEKRLDRIEKILNIKNLKMKPKSTNKDFESFADYREYQKAKNDVRVTRNKKTIQLVGTLNTQKNKRKIKINKVNS